MRIMMAMDPRTNPTMAPGDERIALEFSWLLRIPTTTEGKGEGAGEGGRGESVGKNVGRVGARVFVGLGLVVGERVLEGLQVGLGVGGIEGRDVDGLGDGGREFVGSTVGKAVVGLLDVG